MGICSFSFTGAIIPWLKSSSICSQILEHIIYSNIMNHLSQNNLLSDNHHGFRARRSCETQLITTVQELAKNMSSGKQIDAILLDLSKAFDRVPHRRLLMKLDHYGIRGTTLKWIQDFLKGRTQQVLLDGTHSSTCDVDSGVPQGTVLGPVVPHIHQWLARICHIKCTTIRRWLPPLSCD